MTVASMPALSHQPKLSQQKRVLGPSGASAGTDNGSVPFRRSASSKALNMASESTAWRASAVSSHSIGRNGRCEREQSHSPSSSARRGIRSCSSAVNVEERERGVDAWPCLRAIDRSDPFCRSGGLLIAARPHFPSLAGRGAPPPHQQRAIDHRDDRFLPFAAYAWTPSKAGSFQQLAHSCEGRHKEASRTSARKYKLAWSRRGIFIPPLCRSGTFDLEFIWPAFHIITQSNPSISSQNEHEDPLQEERTTIGLFGSHDGLRRFGYWRNCQERGCGTRGSNDRQRGPIW